jgi:acyl-CoA thioesterase-1
MSMVVRYGVRFALVKARLAKPRLAKLQLAKPRLAKLQLAKLAALALLLLTQPAAAAPVRLLVFGDSLVAGYGLPHDQGFEAVLAAALKADGRDVVILDGGVSGDTTAGGLARLDWSLADKPDAVLLELGANDGLRATDPAETDRNLSAIMDKLAAAHLPVLLTGMEAPPNLGAAYGAQFRAVFAKLGQRPGVIFDPFFLTGVAGDPALVQDDHLHPNAAGVRKEVARIKPLVERLLDQVK